jgi:pimeloyl-ACP methyl ester carboxylesterase
MIQTSHLASDDAMNANEFCRSLTSQYVTVDGVRTHYVECGSGPTVVLIHGLSACLWNWWHNLAELARHFHVIAYDLKGCGRSSARRGPYTSASCVSQLIGLLDQRGIHRAALVGHSMGARIALHTAITRPDRVEALALVAPSCYPQGSGRALGTLLLPGIGELYTRRMFAGRVEDTVRRSLTMCMHPSARIDDDEVYWNMFGGYRIGFLDKQRLTQTYLRYGRHMAFHRPWQLAARYSEIAVPALIVGGDSDRLVPATHCTRLAETLPNARLELWNETGHLPHAERPERFNATTIAFLQRVIQPAPLRRAWTWFPRFRRYSFPTA